MYFKKMCFLNVCLFVFTLVFLFIWSANAFSAEPGTLKWSYTLGCNIDSSPAIDSKGIIYVGSQDDNLYAINPNGTLKWSYETGDDIIWSSPAIGSDGTIYVGSKDTNLYAINPDGTFKWSYETEGYIHSSPAIGSDGTIYVGSHDTYLYAINSDGTLKWRYQAAEYYITSSPAIGVDGTVYVGSGTGFGPKLYAINSDGTLKWTYETGDGHLIASSPAIGADGTVYLYSNNGTLYAINQNGTFKWGCEINSGVDSSPAIGSDGTIYVGSEDNNLYAINPDGTIKWSYETGDWIQNSSPAIGADGTVYVGSRDNKLYAINSDGTLKWSYLTGGWIRSSPTIGADGTVYVGSLDNKLYAINGDSGGLANSAWPMFHHDLRHTGQSIEGSDHLLTTSWNQKRPYTYWYDSNDDGVKEEYLVGCTAVALGQLINYYFQNEYREGWLEVMLQDVTVYPRFLRKGKWIAEKKKLPLDGYETKSSYLDSINRNVSLQEAKDLREFLWYVALGLDSRFTENFGTGAGSLYLSELYRIFENKLKNLLVHRFRFKDEIEVVKKIDSLDEEKEYIIDSIDQGHPILICMYGKDIIRNRDANHVAVIDDYRITNDNYFQIRINMGWGKSFNGYYYADGSITVNKYTFDKFSIYKNTRPNQD